MALSLSIVTAEECQDARSADPSLWPDRDLSREGRNIADALFDALPSGIMDSILSRLFMRYRKCDRQDADYAAFLNRRHRAAGIDLGITMGLKGEALDSWDEMVTRDEFPYMAK